MWVASTAHQGADPTTEHVHRTLRAATPNPPNVQVSPLRVEYTKLDALHNCLSSRCGIMDVSCPALDFLLAASRGTRFGSSSRASRSATTSGLLHPIVHAQSTQPNGFDGAVFIETVPGNSRQQQNGKKSVCPFTKEDHTSIFSFSKLILIEGVRSGCCVSDGKC